MIDNFKIELPVAGEITEGLSCNLECEFDAFKHKGLWNLLNILLSPKDTRHKNEQEFLKSWTVTNEHSKAAASQPLMFSTDLAEYVIEREYKAAMTSLRSNLRTPSERATVYKVLFIAAMQSRRDPSYLSNLLKHSREVLDLDPFVSFLITDAVACRLTEISYQPNQLSGADREKVLAFSYIMLYADKQKHVLEIATYRLIMCSIGLTHIKPSRLSALVQDGIEPLLQSLTPESASVVLVNIVRMMIADGILHGNEKRLIGTIIKRANLSKERVRRSYKFVMLEQGKAAEHKLNEIVESFFAPRKAA